MEKRKTKVIAEWIVPRDGSEPYVERDGKIYTKSQIIELIESYGFPKVHAEYLAERGMFDFFLYLWKRIYQAAVINRLKENGKNEWVIPKDGEAPYMIVQGKKFSYMKMIENLSQMGFRMQLAIEEVENGRYEEAVYEQYERLCVDPIGSYRKAMAALY